MIKKLSHYFPDRLNGYFGEDYLVVREDDLCRVSVKWELKCVVCDKTFLAAPNDILRGCISCACGYRYYKTPELKSEKLLEVLTPKQITFPVNIPILHSHQKVDLTCQVCNLEWKAGWSILVNKQSGCARCAGRYRHSEKEYIKRINNPQHSYRYVSKDFDHEIYTRDVVNVQCTQCELVWKKLVSDAIVGRFGCPSCQTNGYNQSKIGYFYILSVKNSRELLAYKFGISNTPDKRLKLISNRSNLDIKTIALFKFEDGQKAHELEALVKKSFGNFLTKETMPDGYTETISAAELNQLVTFIYQKLETSSGF